MALIFPLIRHGWVKAGAGCDGAPADSDGARHCQRSVEMRLTGRKSQCAIRFDPKRTIDRIDIEVKLEGALLAQTADSDTIRVRLAGNGHRALAFYRAGQ